MEQYNHSKNKVKSPSVDLTPMVDLGFLLISFVVFTTTLFQPVSLGIIMPDEKPTTTPSLLAAQDAIHLILTNAENIYMYTGDDYTSGINTNYAPDGLRKKLTDYIDEHSSKSVSLEKKCVLIKPSANATLGNIVDVLDEISIAGIKKYVLMESTTTELTVASSLIANVQPR